MGRDTLRRFFSVFNIWKGQYYDAEYDMWFDSRTHPYSPDFDGSRDEGDVSED